MKKLIIASVALFGMMGAMAQPAVNTYQYNNAIGLRAGGTSGLTFKHHFSSASSAEFILGIWNNGFSLTGLYEKQAGTGLSGLNWYYGFGGHVAAAYGNDYVYYVRDGKRYYAWYGPYRDRFGLGVDGIIGIEYKIRPIPFALSLDLKPFAEINNRGLLIAVLDPGLGIKFTF